MTLNEWKNKYVLNKSGSQDEPNEKESGSKMTLSEWEQKYILPSIQTPKNEYSYSPAAPAEPPASYYSRPENLWADRESMEENIKQYELNMKILRRNAMDMETAWQKSGSDTSFQMWEDAVNRYNAEYDAYTQYYSAYETYLSDQQNQYDAWRGTIRTPSQLKPILAASDLSIEKAKEEKTRIISQFAEAHAFDFKSIKGTPEEKEIARIDEILTGLYRKRELLDEEYKWAQQLMYEELMQNEDFEKLSKYKSTATGKPAQRNPLSSSGEYVTTGYADNMYEQINKNSDALEKLGLNNASSGRTALGNDKRELSEMSDNEIAIFNYLYAKDDAIGDKEHKSAYEYLDYIRKDLTYRQRQKDAAELEKYAKESPLGSSAFSVMISPLRAFSAAGQAADYLDDGKIDENAGYNKFSHISSDIRGTVSEEVEKKWGAVGSFAYNTGMSMADFVVNTALSGGSRAFAMTLMGSEAAADTVIDGKKRGLSDNQAFTLGVISGIAEAVTEKFSVEAVLDKTTLGKNALGYWLKNTLTEAGEEGASNIINTIADVMVSRDKSEWQTAIDGYIEQGLSEKEAFYKALGDQAVSLGLDMLAGAISGSVMAAPGVAAQGVYSAANKYAEKLEEKQSEDKPAEKSAVYAEKWFAPEVDEKGIYVDQNGNRVMTDGTKITADGQRILATEDTRQQGKRMESAKTVTARTGVATGATDGQIKTAERLAKILDKEIRFTREDGTGRNGEYDPEKDIIYVNAASKKGVTWVVAHELTHSVELSSEYNGLNSFVVAQMERDGVDVDALVKDTQKLYASHGVKLTDTEAKMEVVSDYAADYLLTDVKTIRALVENHPTVGQRIVAWADRILAKGGDEYAEERIILRKARQMYAEALKSAEKKRMEQQEKPKVREEIRANDDPEADSAAEISMPEDDAVDYEAVLAQAEEVFPDAKWSITRTQKEQDAIMSKMRSILQNGGTAADLRAYVDTLGVQERAQTQKKPQGTNTRRQADAASQIVRAAHDVDMTVEEYLRENAELYETEDGWNRDAKRAIEMEQSGRGVKYSIGKVDEVTKDEISALKKHFGTTKNYDVAGYLLTDGSMLDFSGKHWGDDSSDSRQVDHRDVLEGLGYNGVHDAGTNGIKAMTDMIGSGNIRLMPEDGGINLAVEPTKDQIDTLAGYIRHFHGEIVVDIDAPGGDTIESFSYNRGTAPMAVIRDIMNYFEDGTVPAPQPEYRQFRYSISQQNDSFIRDKYYDRKMDRWSELHGSYVKVGVIKATSALHKVGIPTSGLYFDVSKIKKEMEAHGDHLSEEILKGIPDLLNDPITLTEYAPGTGSNTVSVYGNLFVGGVPVVVGVVMKRGNGGNIITKIRTVHARSDLKNQITDDSVLYLKDNKKEINAWYQARGIDVPLGGTQLGVIRSIDFNDSISHNEPSVNGQFSITADRVNVGVDTESKTAYVKHSITSWNRSDYVQDRQEAAREISAALGVSYRKALRYIDDINGIAKMIADDKQRLDYISALGGSSFVSNVEYGGSIDFSTLCPKRRLMSGTHAAIQRLLGNRVMTAEDVLRMRSMMMGAGYEVACGPCYVEGSRANMGGFMLKFIEMYEAYNPDAEWIPQLYDLVTPEGVEWMRLHHPDVYEQYEQFWNNHGKLRESDPALFASQQKPKLFQARTEYDGEILDKFKKDGQVDAKNRNGGLRLQSFSDFEIVHLIDCMQVIMDMARVGLAGQAYTKVPDFAWALGDTGLKINLSVIAKDVGADGRLVMNDVDGMPMEDAVKLRERYSENVGIICLVYNDEQLYAAMADERIDFIIPFHRSQWKKSQYKAMGLPEKVKDYTYQQNEKLIVPTYHEFRGKMVKDKAKNYMPNEYWDPKKSGKENAEDYLKMCAANNKRPKFYKLLDHNADGSYSLKADGSTDGYWKLLVDFKMYDNKGKFAPQKPVQPNFNMDEARRMLTEYAGDHAKLPVAQDIVDAFVEDYEKKHTKVKHSITKTEEGKDLPKPARAMRDFKNNLLALMSIPTRRKLEMGDMIYRYAEQIVKNGRLSEQDRKAFFDMMYNSGVVTLAATEYNKDIRSAVARGKIFVSNELREAIGTEWNTFRNRAFAAGVYLTKNENDPDVKAWQKELSGMFPKTFDAEDTDTRAVLDRIVEYAERGKGEEITLQEHAARLADENYLSMKEFLFELERKFDAELRLFAEKAEIEIDIQEKQAKQKEKEIRKRKEQIEQQRWDDAVHERQRETLKALQWLRSHQNLAPEDLRQQFEEVLAGIDTFAIGHVNERKVSDKYGMTYADISKMYKKLQEEDPNFLPSQELDRIMKRVDYDKIGDLDIGALQNLYQAALALRTEFYNRKNVMGEMNYELFDDVYDQVKEEINRTKGAPKTEGKALFDRLFNGEQLTPMNVLKRMGGWTNGMLYKMAKQLEQGELDEQAYTLKAGDVLRDFEKRHQGWLAHADGQGEDDWITTKVPRLLAMRVGAKPEYGGTVELHMTKLQRVHMLLESESMENLLHMAGGRTFPDVELYRQGKREAAFARGETVRLSPETVKALVSNMTKEEKELANILREYYNGFAKKEINRVSNILYGYDKAMSKRYAPIYTNQNYVNSEPGIFDVTAEGAGNLKSRQHAKNPSLQISALDAFEKHAKRTARFVGLAIPIRNWNTLMNWREKGNSMRDVITHKWGKQGVEYIEKLLTDLQGGKVQETSLIDEAISKLHSNYISSVFGANISIVTKQLGSIAMAMAELDPRYLPSPRKAMKPDKKLIAAYTATLEHRGLGFATPETKMLKEHPNWSQKNKAVQFALGGGAITAMDQFSAGVLWPWAENKVRAEHPELEMGSDEQITAGESPFYKKVAEVFNDAVWNSQSAADIMHQSTLRRSNSALVRSFTMFKSDSAQAYNQLRRLIGEAQYLRDSKAPEKEQKAAKRRVGHAVLGILLSNGLAASVSFVNAWIKNGAKGYKDDEDELTVLSVLEEMTRDMITGLAGVFALGEELADLIGNVMAKERIYDIETPGIDVLNDLINAVASGTKNAAGFVDGAISIIKNGGDIGRYLAKNARDVFGAVKSTAIEVSSLLGVPAANVEAYLVGFVRIVSPEIETAYQDLFGTQTKSDLVGLKGAALDQRVGDILMSRDVELTKDAVQTIAALYDSGHKSVIPSDVPSSITIDEESHKLNEAQKQKYAEVWAYAVEKNLQGVLNSEEFRAADLDSKVYMVGKVYRYGEEFAKKALFEEYKLTEWVLEVSKFEDADMDMAQYLGVQDTKNGIYERTEDKDFRGVEFAKWVVEQGFTDEQLRVIRDVFGKEPENYYNLVAAGVNSDRAYRLLKNLIKLEPADGRKSVTSVQKARVVVDALLPEDEEMAALSQVLSESDYAKTEMAAAHKVKPSIYVTFKELLPQYDVNGNGSYSQEEVERAIDAIGPKTGIALPSYGSANAINTNLNNSQRAVLWQLANKSWKPESNPYNTSVGRKVYEELNND